MRRPQALMAAMLMAVAAWGIAKGDVFAGTSRTVTAGHRAGSTTGDSPTFYRDVLPILQGHCEVCHRSDGIAPMTFTTYQGTRPYAEAIRLATGNRSMPPWFAVPGIGHFSNDPTLTAEQIATLAAWVDAKAPEGDVKDAPAPVHWAESWTIPQPDLILKMTKGVALPASGDVDYTYEIVP